MAAATSWPPIPWTSFPRWRPRQCIPLGRWPATTTLIQRPGDRPSTPLEWKLRALLGRGRPVRWPRCHGAPANCNKSPSRRNWLTGRWRTSDSFTQSLFSLRDFYAFFQTPTHASPSRQVSSLSAAERRRYDRTRPSCQPHPAPTPEQAIAESFRNSPRLNALKESPRLSAS
jgi:hypothetical protein